LANPTRDENEALANPVRASYWIPIGTESATAHPACRVLCQDYDWADYNAKANLNVKVLDFVQFGGPDLTVDSTIFEMWMGL